MRSLQNTAAASKSQAIARLRDAADAVLDYAVLPDMMNNPRYQREAFGIRIEDLRALRDALAALKALL
jgi:hypothetical protein